MIIRPDSECVCVHTQDVFFSQNYRYKFKMMCIIKLTKQFSQIIYKLIILLEMFTFLVNVSR